LNQKRSSETAERREEKKEEKETKETERTSSRTLSGNTRDYSIVRNANRLIASQRKVSIPDIDITSICRIGLSLYFAAGISSLPLMCLFCNYRLSAIRVIDDNAACGGFPAAEIAFARVYTRV